MRTISRKDLGEEAPVRPRIEVDLLGILRDHTPDPCRNVGKIWSDLCGDMQRPAEMSGPSDYLHLLSLWEKIKVRANRRVTKCLR